MSGKILKDFDMSIKRLGVLSNAPFQVISAFHCLGAIL